MNNCYSCHAQIEWARTKKKRIPLDIGGPHSDGNLFFVDSDTVVALGGEQLVTAQQLGQPLYRSHFVTCPFARQHRRPREKK